MDGLGELLNETPERARGHAIRGPRGEQCVSVCPPITEIATKRPDGVVLELECCRRRVPLLDRHRKEQDPGLEVDVIDVETDEFAGVEPGIVGERDDRLVAILQVSQIGVGETLIAELLDLFGLQPGSGAPIAIAVGTVVGSVGATTANVRVRGVGRCRVHGYLTGSR